MAQNLLRSIVAGPRARHQESNLDLAYITDNIIATSGPSATYPQRAYRNPLPSLTRFLTSKHAAEWRILEYRAEGTGYPDHLVEDRIYHFPWPDHHPPPFALVPQIMGAMRSWLRAEDAEKDGRHVEVMIKDGVHVGVVDGVERVVVGHCKAGKGRTGTMACSFLISEENWKREDALQRFTERRMRPGMGKGVSIPSQLRWLRYVERWATSGRKVYVDRPVEVKELHVLGLRDGVKFAVEGYVEEGRVIKTFHVFKQRDRDEPGEDQSLHENENENKITNTLAEVVLDVMRKGRDWGLGKEEAEGKPEETRNVVYKPTERVVLPTSDVNIATERRSKAGAGWTVVTSVSHVWFNAFFEGAGPESVRLSPDQELIVEAKASGVFEIFWEDMDGIKGSARKGSKSFDKIQVVWALPDASEDPLRPPTVIAEPGKGEPITGRSAADWQQRHDVKEGKLENEGEGTGRVSSQPGLRPKTSDIEDTKEEDLRRSAPSTARGILDRALVVHDSDEDGVDGIHANIPADSQERKAKEN